MVSDYLRIKNVRWNGTDLIFQIWWYNGTEPALIKTYLWHDPISALDAVKESKSGAYSVQSLENQFVIKPLSVSPGVRIVGVDYLTNDGSGEYVYIENPSITTVSLKGWYLLDDYAYSNQKCWVNNNLPRDECHDSFGRNHIFKLSMSLAPHTVREVPLASSPSNAILNNDGDTLYLIDRWGNLVSMYHYAASPNITIEDVLIYPASPVNGDNLRLRVRLDNRGSLDGTGKIEVYIDGTLVATRSGVKIRRYSIATYTIKNVWNAKAGTHSLIVKFVPEYNGNTQTFGMIFKVSEVHPRIRDVHYENAIESHPLRFSVTAENPSGSKVNVKLTLFIDGAMEYGFNKGFLYGHSGYGFYLIWKRPEAGYHTVTILMQSSDGSTSKWEKRIYVKPNSPPSIVDLELPSMVYAGENSNGSVLVADGDGDKVTVKVNILGHYGFRLRDIAPGKVRKFPLAPIYNRTNCREEVTVEATPVDEYGRKGKPVTRTITVITDSDKDGWCNALELEYGTNPYSSDTDGDGVIDPKDVDPLRDAKIKVYILRARALDDVDSGITHNPADMSLELTVNGQTKTLLLTDNQDDYEKKIIPAINPFTNLQSYAIATATFDIPDDKDLATIRFHLYDRDDNGKRTEMDVSPGKGTVATVYYNLKTGTWGGDDYPGDEEKYFGYGHLSGCGDGSCNVGPKEPDKDLKVYVKYESILEKAGINGEIIGMKTIEGVSDVTVKDGTKAVSIVRPKSLRVAQVRLENGTVINVTLVNVYGASLSTPTKTENSLDQESLEESSNKAITLMKGKPQVVTTSGKSSLNSTLVVTYSSDREEKDGEIWFVITTNDADGIPFYREIELNRELEAKGFTARFDPSDRKADDMNGDYDDDGVPNTVEQLIGKDPAKRDILGIELNISVEWTMSEEDKKNLAYSIRKASDFIYDYTDGYAMITRVNIWDNKRNWERADVRVYNAEWGLPVVNKDQWPASIVGGYWMSSGYIQMPKRFFRISTNSKGEIGDDKWGRTLGHELGHYVFWLGDEYKDWHDHGYKTWYVLIASSYDKYRILNDRLLSIHSVMNNEWKWSELSTPQEYAEFKSDAIYFMEQYSGNIFLLGYTSWEDALPAQWGNVTKNPQTDYPIWHCSAWGAVYSFLSGHNTPLWITNTFKPENHPRRQRVLISIPSVGDNFIPKTGPYTGVGYFMEEIWG